MNTNVAAFGGAVATSAKASLIHQALLVAG